MERRYRTCREMSTEGSDVFVYAQELGSSTNAETLKSLFEDISKRQSSGRHTPFSNSLFWNIRSGNS
jgi:hypothetical protein